VGLRNFRRSLAISSSANVVTKFKNRLEFIFYCCTHENCLEWDMKVWKNYCKQDAVAGKPLSSATTGSVTWNRFPVEKICWYIQLRYLCGDPLQPIIIPVVRQEYFYHNSILNTGSTARYDFLCNKWMKNVQVKSRNYFYTKFPPGSLHSEVLCGLCLQNSCCTCRKFCKMLTMFMKSLFFIWKPRDVSA